MVVPKVNSDSITWKNTCLAKQRVHCVNENEKHINHDMSEGAEGETKERRKNVEPSIGSPAILFQSMWNHVSHYADLKAE